MYECRHSVGKRKRKAKSEIHRRSIFLSTPVTGTMLTWRMKNHIDLRASTALYSWMAYVWRKEQPLFPSITFLPCTSVDSHGRLDLDDFLREFRCFSYSVLRRPSESPLWLCRQFSLAIVRDGQWSRNKSIVDVDLLLKRGEYKKKKKKKNNPPRYQEKNNNRDNSGYDHTHTQGGTQSSNGPDRPWRIRRLPSVWGPYSLLPLFFFLLFFLCRCPVCCWSFVLPMRIISINYRRHWPFSLSRQRFYFIFLPPLCSLYTWRRFLFTPG